MSDLKDFKIIADEMMQDITVSPELMEKTLNRLRRKNVFPLGKLVLTAACLVLVIGVMNFSGLFQNSGMQPKVTPNDTNLTPFSTLSTESLALQNTEEAKTIFGDAFLAPGYLPEGFHEESISANGDTKETATRIELLYAGNTNQTYKIIEEKRTAESNDSSYKSIEINGVLWYSASTGDAATTELTRYSNGVLYTITGSIHENEAIKLAESMK